MADQRELIGTCIIGAIYAPNKPSVNGYYARNKTQPDGNNLLPETYYYINNNKEISERLKPVPQFNGGLIPEVNPHLVAPNLTYVYGYLQPSQTCNVHNLIMAPGASDQYLSNSQIKGYNPPFTGTNIPNTYNGTIPDNSAKPNPGLADKLDTGNIQYPYIPSRNNIYTNAQINKTYNIWQLTNYPENNFIYQAFYNPIPQANNISTIHQNIDQSSASIHVNAINNRAIVQRLYPISKDLAYENAYLYYPATSTANVAPAPRKINAKGSINCGFQLKFQYCDLSQNENPAISDSNASIVIRWGKNGTPDPNYISQYNLILTPDKSPELAFYNPQKQQWDKIKFTNEIYAFGKFDKYYVCVHYVGPSMLIGFGTTSSDTVTWHNFNPIPADWTNDNNYTYHKVPEDSIIDIIFTNIQCSFEYGPMAFNNYHPENYDSTNNTSDLGNVNFTFSYPYPQDTNADLNQITQSYLTEIQTAFDSHRYTINGNSYDKMDTMPSYHGDYRSSSSELNCTFRSDSNGATYTYNKQNGILNVNGRINFNTTIEGPIFSHVRTPIKTTTITSTSSNPAIPTPQIVKSLEWGDISEWLYNWDVTYEAAGRNSSYLTASATVVLHNIATNPIGQKILDLLENNVFAITLGAGYGETIPYFQGIITSISTTYSHNGSITTIQAKDLMSKMLHDIPFRTTFNFKGMRYGRILDFCIECAGLSPWYSRQTGTQAFETAMNYRLSYLPQENPIASEILFGTPLNSIESVTKNALELIINLNGLPVMFYDPIQQYIYTVQRQNPKYIDTLKFLGNYDADGNILLPNSTDASNPTENLHGVLKSSYIVNTILDQLQAGLRLYGKSLDSNIITYINDYYNAYNYESLSSLNNAFNKPSNTFEGYIGYNKVAVSDVKNTLCDQESLNKYGQALDNLLQHTYQNISFDCYVTRPLNHFGQFIIQTFLNGTQNATDAYFYKQVKYTFDKENNTIVSHIQGEKFPSVFLKSGQLTNDDLNTEGISDFIGNKGR